MASQSNEGPATAANPTNNNNDGTTVIPTMTAQPPSHAPVTVATTEGDNAMSGATAVTPVWTPLSGAQWHHQSTFDHEEDTIEWIIV